MTSFEELRELNRRPKYRRLAPSTLRAAWWAARSVRRIRRDLPKQGVDSVVAAPPPSLRWGARTGVDGVLLRLKPNCIEGALVRQAWLHAHGVDRDVVVGVRNSDTGAVEAHAWVDGWRDVDAMLHTEIHRIAPRGGPAQQSPQRSGETLRTDQL